MVDLKYVKFLVEESAKAAGLGFSPNLNFIVTRSGGVYLSSSTTSDSPAARASDMALAAEGTHLSKEGTVLYSYGQPEMTQSELFMIEKVVYLVENEEFERRGLPAYELPKQVLAVRFPHHPSLHAEKPLKVWDSLSS